jgi:hypothetical protein
MSSASEVHLHDPQTLYRHWEESQWSPWEVDLSVDREQWEAMEERTLVSPAGADTGALGASAEELRAFALDGLTRRLMIIGVPIDTL